MSPRRELIEACVVDLVGNLLHYGRKGDEELGLGQIEEAVAAGEITVDEMIALFAEKLREDLSSP